MTNNQYKNIVDMTLNDAHNVAPMDSTELTRTIMNNCGVAFPNGSLSDVTDALNTDEYMGWRKCTASQAIEYANAGTPVIGVDANSVTVVTPTVEAEADRGLDVTIATEANVVSTSALSAEETSNTQYYAYYAGTTTTTELLEIYGIPNGDVTVGQTFTLNGAYDSLITVDVKWEYDESKFCVWTDFMYHNFFTNFHAIAPGQTTIKASFGGLKRDISINIIDPEIVFDANGGCVSQNSISAAMDSVIILPTPTYDDDHIFMGWFTATDNTEKVGDAGDQYVVKGSTTLYAQWLFLRKRFLTQNACYVSNKDKHHEVSGIMVHSTGANNCLLGRYIPKTAYDNYPEDTLLTENKYKNHWNVYHPGCPDNSPNNTQHPYTDTVDDGESKCDTCGGRQACVHAFVGKLKDGRVAVYQTLPWDIPGWHSGSSTNGSANRMGYIGFEICEDDTDDEYLKAAYHEAVKLCAYLCKQFDETIFVDDKPMADAIISHKEGHVKKKIASNHGDPDHWFNPKGYTMDGFRQDVQNMLE